MQQIFYSYHLDRAGRISIPKDIREKWNLQAGTDAVSITTEEQMIFISAGGDTAAGLLRHMDAQGRIVLPKSMRNHLSLRDGEDTLDLFLDQDRLILKKHRSTCCFCGNMGILQYGGHAVCADCIRHLYEALENQLNQYSR